MEPGQQEIPPARNVRPRGRKRAFLIFFAVLIVLAAAGFLYWWHARQFASTDDAQVNCHMNPIGARIDGTVVKVYVDNNQMVHAGDPLVDLDPRNYKAAMDQALARLAQAKSMIVEQRPSVPITQVQNVTNISTAEAGVANAKAALAAAKRDRESYAAKLAESQAKNARAQADRERYSILIKKQEVSEQEYQQAVAAAKASTAAVAANRAALQSAGQTIAQRKAQLQEAQSRLAQYKRVAPNQLTIRKAMVRSNEANAEMAEAQVEQARLKLAYCHITAPVSGIVINRTAEVGKHVAAGQALVTIVQVNDLWVTANFKETQLADLHPGESATIHVDALGRDFKGYVQSIGGSTGSVASVLPPENATGNYVKVVQRIPVRLRFKPNQKGLAQLRPGMSVEPQVRISH
ncbi:MAG TPA: HlyD family secretion protein [Bryobacteraceae bacterium]